MYHGNQGIYDFYILTKGYLVPGNQGTRQTSPDPKKCDNFLIFFLVELEIFQRQFWRALKKSVWVFKVLETIKMSSSPAKTPLKNFTFYLYQYA